MIEPEHPRLSVVRQCELVSISRSGFYYRPAGETPLNVTLMRLIDAQFLETPWYGSRQMARHLRREGYTVGRKRVRRLMARMGLEPIYQRPRTTVPHPGHRIYPYLLREMVIERPEPGLVRRHHLHSDAAWLPLSGCGDGLVDAGRCCPGECRTRWTLSSALRRWRKPWRGLAGPDIFNTDQGSQFTSPRFTGVLQAAGVRISMDGRGRWMDNVFIERLWRSLKYECIYLHAFETGIRAARRADLMDRLLQFPAPTFDPGRMHARRGIQGDQDAETGVLTTIRTKLNKADKLSSRRGPPLRCSPASGGLRVAPLSRSLF